MKNLTKKNFYLILQIAGVSGMIITTAFLNFYIACYLASFLSLVAGIYIEVLNGKKG